MSTNNIWTRAVEKNQIINNIWMSTNNIWFIWTRAVVCAVGIGLNAVLILASFKLKRSSRNACSLLIVFDAITVLMYSSGGIISLITFLSLPAQLALQDCVPYQIVPLAGFFLNRIAIFAISFDRLLSIVFPIWYKNRSQPIYLCSVAMLALSYTAANLFVVLREDFAHPNVSVWCSMADLFQSLNGPISQSIIALNTFSLLFYAVIWHRIRQNRKRVLGLGLQIPNQKNASSSYTERMFRSLVVIMATIFFGYIMASVVKTLISLVKFTPSTEYILTNSSSLLSVLTSASQPLILYVFSKEYRNAINQAILYCCPVNRTEAVTNSQVRQQTTHSFNASYRTTTFA